jgi:PEP-CTERM motif
LKAVSRNKNNENECDNENRRGEGKMKKTIITLLAVITIICLSNFAQATFVATYNPSSPTIDGVQDAGEWGASNAITMDRVDDGAQHNSGLYFQHDGTYLFVGVDSQWGSGWDVVWDFDIDGDYSRTLNGSLSEPYVDVNICRPSPTGYPGYIAYRTILSPIDWVSVGFGSGAACASGGSSNVFYEFRIPLADLTATNGDSIGVMISHGYDGIPAHRYQLSGSERYAPESWATLQLQIPEPGTISLLMVGALALLRRKRG